MRATETAEGALSLDPKDSGPKDLAVRRQLEHVGVDATDSVESDVCAELHAALEIAARGRAVCAPDAPMFVDRASGSGP